MSKITGEDLFRAIGEIDDEVLLTSRSRKRRYIYAAIACAATVFMVSSVVLLLGREANRFNLGNDLCGPDVYVGELQKDYYVYYVHTEGLYVYNLTDNKVTSIFETDKYIPYTADDRYVYYVDYTNYYNLQVCKYDMKNDTAKTLCTFDKSKYFIVEPRLCDNRLRLCDDLVIDTEDGRDVTSSSSDIINKYREYNEEKHIENQAEYTVGKRKFLIEDSYRYDKDTKWWYGSRVLYEIKGTKKECITPKNNNDEYCYSTMVYQNDDYIIIEQDNHYGSKKCMIYFADGSQKELPGYIINDCSIQSVIGDNIYYSKVIYSDDGYQYYKIDVYNILTDKENELTLYEDEDCTRECFEQYKDCFYGGFTTDGNEAFSCGSDKIVRWHIIYDEEGIPTGLGLVDVKSVL